MVLSLPLSCLNLNTHLIRNLHNISQPLAVFVIDRPYSSKNSDFAFHIFNLIVQLLSLLLLLFVLHLYNLVVFHSFLQIFLHLLICLLHLIHLSNLSSHLLIFLLLSPSLLVHYFNPFLCIVQLVVENCRLFSQDSDLFSILSLLVFDLFLKLFVHLVKRLFLSSHLLLELVVFLY